MLLRGLPSMQILNDLCDNILQITAMHTPTYTGDDILEVLGEQLQPLLNELQYNLHVRCNEDLGVAPADLRSLCDQVMHLYLAGRPQVINSVTLKFIYCQLCYANNRELTQEELITYLEFHLGDVNTEIDWTIVIDGWCDRNKPWSMKVTNGAYRRRQAQEAHRGGMALMDAMQADTEL